MPDFCHENSFGRNNGKVICGVDEVGRGPLAGPVVAAAIILPQDFPASISDKIRDSKKMTGAAREALYQPLTELCLCAIAEASIEEIDSLNILWASMLAMQRALTGVQNALPAGQKMDMALIDGNRAPKTNCPTTAIVKGDDKSLSIAAASIIAKVHRDRLMKKLALDFPAYGWESNAGYGTQKHMEAIARLGITPWHRTSFAPIRAATQNQN